MDKEYFSFRLCPEHQKELEMWIQEHVINIHYGIPTADITRFFEYGLYLTHHECSYGLCDRLGKEVKIYV